MKKELSYQSLKKLRWEFQLGMALEGFVPITMYPRFDFFILSCNKLINHLDKMRDMSKGDMTPRVIIRVAVGSKNPN